MRSASSSVLASLCWRSLSSIPYPLLIHESQTALPRPEFEHLQQRGTRGFRRSCAAQEVLDLTRRLGQRLLQRLQALHVGCRERAPLLDPPLGQVSRALANDGCVLDGGGSGQDQ